MNTALQTQMKTPTSLSLTPVNTGLLQRKCACGGPAGLTGDCEECTGKQLNLQRLSMKQEAQHRSDSTSEMNIRAALQWLSKGGVGVELLSEDPKVQTHLARRRGSRTYPFDSEHGDTSQ